MIVEAVTLWATAFLILFIDENNDYARNPVVAW